MIRLVLDTNVVVSGLLWWGSASNILWSVQSGGCTILTTLPMMKELEAVLCRSKFQYRFKELNTEPEEPLTYYRNMVRYCRVPHKSNYTGFDVDDQKFIDLAIAEHAHLLVSGDKHVLDMKEIGDIAIVNVQEAVRVLQHLAVIP
jgi:putative PIN family toxin of toxin-antitoxin system